MINNVVLVGRITQELELQTTANGNKLVKFALAFDGERPGEDTNFIPCTVWAEQAENMCQYVGKGSLIGIQGRISVRKYETNTGEKRTFTEVIGRSVKFLETKADRLARTQEFKVQPEIQNPQPTSLSQPKVEKQNVATSSSTETSSKDANATIDWLDSFL